MAVARENGLGFRGWGEGGGGAEAGKWDFQGGENWEKTKKKLLSSIIF